MGIFVVLLAGGIIGGIGLSMRRQNSLGSAAERMRKVYVALSLYEESVEGMPAPDLAAIDLYLPEPVWYQAENDPYVGHGDGFPVDGSLPDSRRTAPYRISLAYLWAHRPAKPSARWDWATLSKDQNVGFLANEWMGSVRPTGDFRAEVSGPVLRINRDGSLAKTPDRGAKPLGDVEDLFGLGQ